MRRNRMLGVATIALALGLLGAGKSFALSDDADTTYTQPANALVMPFDQTENHNTYLLVSNVSGLSPVGDGGFIAGVTTHWAFWSDSCDHLADVYICLTLNDTVVVDPSKLSAIDAGNNEVGPLIDLTGERGLVVVTAYRTDEICSESSVRGNQLVDDAIVGTYTFANTDKGFAFGNDAIGLGTSFNNDYTQLPADEWNDFTLQSFNPEELDNSTVVLMSLKEASGSGATALKEVGPNSSTITADVVFYDNFEIPTSLPEQKIKCTKFTTVIPGDDSLIPKTVSLLSSGTIRFPRFPRQPRTFVYGIHGQAIGQYGGSSNMKYKLSSLDQ